MTDLRLADTALRGIITTADDLGIALPKQVRTDIENVTTTAQQAAVFCGTGPNLARLIVEVIAAGRDPFVDKGVREAATASTIAATLASGAITEAIEQRTYAVAVQHADAVINGFKPKYLELGELLAADHAILTAAGINDLAHATISVSTGSATAAAHARALATTREMTRITNALALLRGTVGWNGSPVAALVLNADAPGVSASELRSHGTNLTPWDIVGQGWTPSLATATEVEARYSAAYALQEVADQAVAEAGQDAFRTHHGTGQSIRI